ncbi:MAG TPA: DUF554 family protein [Dermatophilaceae bacterium]|nr:DUF554 family protein [Dermatophilaceae bacterium]
MTDGALSDAVRRFGAGGGNEARERFIQGLVISSLVFCVGPLTILRRSTRGWATVPTSFSSRPHSTLHRDRVRGILRLGVGWGVGASVLALIVIQGGLTALGAGLGSVVPDAHLSALTATGSLLLVGVAFRLLDLKQIKWTPAAGAAHRTGAGRGCCLLR